MHFYGVSHFDAFQNIKKNHMLHAHILYVCLNLVHFLSWDVLNELGLCFDEMRSPYPTYVILWMQTFL